MSKLEILDREAWLENPITKEFFSAVKEAVETMKKESSDRSADVSFLMMVDPTNIYRGFLERAARIDALNALIEGAKDILLNPNKEKHGSQ